MKLLRNISLPLIASLALFACERDYDAPLLTEPEYTGPAANITISELRTQNAAATQDVPIIITQDQVLKAVITGNDESGNIFKKIYLQDETGAIEMEVDQSSVYNYYPVGQTVYVDLNGLSISVYGDEQQLGHPEGYLFRTPWEDFEKHVSKDGWANPENAKPVVIDDISTINAAPDNYKFKLVQFTGVTFQNGGKGIFAPEDGYGEENITDSHGNTIMIRTSNYASFAGNKLPEGKGNVTGILGRFRGTWQLTLRTANDVSDFTGSNEEGGNEGGETPSGETVLFQESFGTPEKSGNYWPKIAEYTGFDNPGFFEDESGKADVRIGSAYPANVWFPKGSDINLKVKGINGQGATKATLKYQVGCNVYNSGETQDLNTLKIKCNGTELPLSSKVVSGENQEGNKPFEFEIKDINISNNTTLEFYTTAADNTYGLRLFSVKLYVPGSGSGSTGGDGGTTIEPTPSN
ncbi:DUF5689 domain-containing protein [Phocaeicola plebeius]|jgi:hypothetical protein|uniref:DUF5689 domain-containing protein n=1 Tax=Phocaeicola plebeius CAG:211 TaxID=1263052 RepID=R5VA39_9BACT|nr:DUF5689 domain-containing protein [Phocaeicola plebeius]CCZ87260.1 putative uncharacterized protein [Phocaeicola plebeius CAG:211]